MIETIKDADGKILALLAWQLFNEDYVICDDGEIFGVLEIFIHESLDGVATMKHFSKVILDQVPTARQCVYYRDGGYRIFERRHFERMAR